MSTGGFAQHEWSPVNYPFNLLSSGYSVLYFWGLGAAAVVAVDVRCDVLAVLVHLLVGDGDAHRRQNLLAPHLAPEKY